MQVKPFEDEIDNPFILPILSLLEKSNKSWKVHHFLVELENDSFMVSLDEDAQLDLFKRNFLIMNALYQLQETLLPQQWLQTESMDIRLMPRLKDNYSKQEIDVLDPLREYYLDWKNYDAKREDVRELLNSFWRRYQSEIGSTTEERMERKKALAVLGLKETASEHEIRHQWRKMALKWHPDRSEGDAATFRKMCEAWRWIQQI